MNLESGRGVCRVELGRRMRSEAGSRGQTNIQKEEAAQWEATNL